MNDSYVFYVIYYDPTDLSSADNLNDSEEGEQVSLVTPYEGRELSADEREALLKNKISPAARAIEKKKQMIYFVIYHICTFIVIFIGYMMIVIGGPYNTAIIWYSYILGAISAVVVLIQFSPQIYITYKLKVSNLIILKLDYNNISLLILIHMV